MNVRICDSDFDIMNIYLSGLEVDVLFRANERFVIRSFLSSLVVEHLSDVSLYTKVYSYDFLDFFLIIEFLDSLY